MEKGKKRNEKPAVMSKDAQNSIRQQSEDIKSTLPERYTRERTPAELVGGADL